MRRAFLSYRRDDTQFITSTLYHQLEEPAAFGPASVFMDIDDIPPGVDFRDVIDEAVGKCEFFLTVIGRRWVTARLMDPNDFVRLEIEAALRRNIPVTPLLVDGATMPRKEELPDSLHPLLFKNGVTIRHGKDFKPDVLRLVEGLQKAAEWFRMRAAGERRDASPPVATSGEPGPQGPRVPPPAGLAAEVRPEAPVPVRPEGPSESFAGPKPGDYLTLRFVPPQDELRAGQIITLPIPAPRDGVSRTGSITTLRWKPVPPRNNPNK